VMAVGVIVVLCPVLLRAHALALLCGGVGDWVLGLECS
jgi:hypothetical protein